MTATTTPTANPDVLTAKTICLALKRSKFGNTKNTSMAPVEVNADKSLLKMSKRLLDSPELKAIDQHDGKVQKRLSNLGHSAMFKGGIYLISIPMVENVDLLMHEFAAERTVLVDAACHMYQTRVDETTARLKVVANPFDYPPVEAFRAKFSFTWNWITFDTPTRLKAISAALFEQERLKAADQLASLADECRNAMRAQMLKLVAHMKERLTPSEDGKTKKFTKGTVANLNEFLNMFEMKDITDDSDLGALVKQARAAMEGLDAKDLQSDELIRQKMQQVFGELETSLSTMVVTAGDRDITFDDEGPLPTSVMETEEMTEPEDIAVV